MQNDVIEIARAKQQSCEGAPGCRKEALLSKNYFIGIK